MDVTPYKKSLETERALLHTQLRELGVQNLTVPEDWIATPDEPIRTEADENVVADRAEDWIERRGEVAELETRYNKVTEALGRIADGSYGTCTVCHKEIERDRLEANPAASTCTEHRDTATQPLV